MRSRGGTKLIGLSDRMDGDEQGVPEDTAGEGRPNDTFSGL